MDSHIGNEQSLYHRGQSGEAESHLGSTLEAVHEVFAGIVSVVKAHRFALEQQLNQ
ncbi:MAG: hypothetical protein JSV99_12170 [Planctomycetota bacterium]|nr:MAG: hypothetical protein JSV99_12170 [Planctomycetota bacterium]